MQPTVTTTRVASHRVLASLAVFAVLVAGGAGLVAASNDDGSSASPAVQPPPAAQADFGPRDSGPVQPESPLSSAAAQKRIG